MVDLVGQQIGNYRLLRLLGRGGFAEVYLGEHVYLGTSAAIKILRAQLASEDVAHFQVEARTIARLAHPHIVRVLDFGVTDATPYLVVDYAPNGTLRKRHPKSSLPSLATIVTYVTQLSSALQYAHDQKVIHRDVKPENMLLGRDNEVLLSDFGIALVAQSSNFHSTQGIQELAGTISYMAPEQIQSRACTNSDQYSLGVVVYEWLSGTRPFQGSFTEIAVRHTLVPPPPLHEKVPTIAPAIEAVVMKALAKDPNERYENMRTFAHALQQAYLQLPATTIHLGNTLASTEQSSAGVETIQLSYEEENSPAALLTVPIQTTALPVLTDTTAVPPLVALETPAVEEVPSLAPTVRRSVTRRNVLRGLIGVAAIGAAGGGLAWLLYNRASSGLLSPSLLSSAAEGSTLYTFRGHSSWVWAAAWSPDSARIASASGDGTAQTWDALSGDHLTIFYGHSDSVYTVAWSPDGKRIASGGYDKTVQVWDATYGDHYLSYPGHTALVWSVAWSPDGKRIASGGYDKTVQVWDATYGDHYLSYSGHTALVWSVAWSPNGKRIASAGGDKTVQVWDATNGLSRVMYRGHTGFVYRIAWSPDSKFIASASDDGTVQVWDATDGHMLYTFQTMSASVLAVAWSFQGQRIVSAGSDGKVQVWDAMSGDHLYIYYGHSDFVYAVAWSPDGARIASGGDDKIVRVWNATDGSDAYIYHGHSDSVRSVAWAPDGKYITSASWDRTVQVWRA